MRGARQRTTSAATLSLALIGAQASGCSQDVEGEPALSKVQAREVPVPTDVPVPPADGPKLGAVAHVTPVFDRPSKKGEVLGYLHAGARVTRAEEPYSSEGCPNGWYPIRPRGFVCATETATTDMRHPTLVAMAIRPKLDEPMPLSYARTTKKTAIFKVDPKRDQGVLPVGTLPRRSGLAVVGSWKAEDPEGTEHRLAMMTDGRFVRAGDLDASEPSSFAGVELDKEMKLPIAYVVKRGVRAWAVDGRKTEKRNQLDYHKMLPLTGTYRTIDKLRFWEVNDGSWVRHKDVTVIRRRNSLPEFVTRETKWVDISIVTGTMVAYEGTRAVYASLVSVGRDRLGDPKTTDSTEQGEFPVAAKHITSITGDPKIFADGVHLYDVPWVLEMSNGQLLHAAYWHDRFGIEHGPGNIQLSPGDALRIWHWLGPAIPENWHGVAESEPLAMINVRK